MISTWYMSAEAYLEKAIPIVIEDYFGPLKALFSSRISAPASPDYHPELDQTDLLLDDDIGISRWAIELGRIDLAQHTGAVLSKFLEAPQQGHLVVAIVKVLYFIQLVINMRYNWFTL